MTFRWPWQKKPADLLVGGETETEVKHDLSRTDFTGMTLDELEAWSLAKKADIARQRQEYHLAGETRRKLVNDWHYNEAVIQLTIAADKAGVSVYTMAQRWLVETNNDPGHNVQARLYLGLPRIRDI